MSATGLEVFDKTLHTTNTWLGQIMATLGPDRQIAWHVLGAVLRALRDRIPLGLAAHLGAQLPLLVRGAFYDRWRPREQPTDWRSLDEFLSIIAGELSHLRPVDPKDAARSVFQTLDHYLDPGQVEKVREALPEEVRRLWSSNKVGGGRNVGSAA
jgi:uncharacterized protein (DUF2267 family)